MEHTNLWGILWYIHLYESQMSHICAFIRVWIEQESLKAQIFTTCKSSPLLCIPLRNFLTLSTTWHVLYSAKINTSTQTWRLPCWFVMWNKKQYHGQQIINWYWKSIWPVIDWSSTVDVTIRQLIIELCILVLILIKLKRTKFICMWKKVLIGANIDYFMVDDCIQFLFMIPWRLVTWMNENREQITVVPRNNLTPHLAAFCFQNTHALPTSHLKSAVSCL